ncbi:MAG: response regulator [Ignavibacteriae bacterium]|nr:response regulator [Ignavibacteriota bacterium]
MHQPKILVVDDDENILSAFRDFLRKERYGMITASSAEEAMEHLGQHHVDLLIADVRLKAQSGVTLLMEAKRMFPNLRIIVITGYPDLVNEKDVKAFGADFFFLKPLDIEKLRGAISICLKQCQMEQRIKV